MKKDNIVFSQCFQLLRDVFRDAFHVPVLYFTPPYQDIKEIDQGIRASIWRNYSHTDTGIQFSEKNRPFRILIIKSNLGFYNVLISLNAEELPDFISIGPFRKEELSSTYYIKILKEAHVPPASIQGIKYIYEQMPVVAPDTITKMAKDMLCVFIPEFSSVTPENYAFTEQKREISVDLALLEDKLLTTSEQYTRLLQTLLDTIYHGNTENMSDALRAFLYETKVTDQRNLHESKMMLLTLNSYCHLTLLQSSIHPSHVLKESFSIMTEVDKASSLTELKEMPLSICQRYCLLAKKHNHQQYTKVTKNVISYIQLHMEDDLSLHQIAEHFGKNPSVLSASFHKDTGETLTRFIHKTRVQEALKLLHYSDLSISDIAVSVGYQDFSYFSKIFSREVGCSPRQYKKNL